jgi:hypothetical protein
LNTDNDRFRKFLGADVWHKAGYTGSRVIAGSAEDFNTSNHGAHEYLTYATFKEFAPDAQVLYLPAEGYSDERFMQNEIEIIKERGVSCWFQSRASYGIGDSYSTDKDAAFEKVKEFCTFFNSIGNDGDNGYASECAAKWVYGVGAIYVMYDSGQPAVTPYTSTSEYVDFAAPAMIWIENQPFDGTSCSCPVLCGEAALINDFFIDRTGFPLTSKAMYQFMKDNSVDIYTPGKDMKSGFGYVKLPDPSAIDISKYVYLGDNKPTGGENVVTAKQVLAVAENEIGYLEKASNANLDDKTANAGSANYTKYGKWYGMNPAQWCAMFVSWCMAQAGMGNNAPKYASCYTGIEWCKQNSQFHVKEGYNPKPGDIIFFSSDKYPNGGAHTGIVEYYDGARVHTIEGNTSGGSTLVSNGGGVAKKSYLPGYTKIYGYGTPIYAAAQEDDDMTEDQVKKIALDAVTEYFNTIAAKPEPDWSKTEGYWKAASEQKVKDGSKTVVNGQNPESYLKRDEFVAVLGRLGIVK